MSLWLSIHVSWSILNCSLCCWRRHVWFFTIGSLVLRGSEMQPLAWRIASLSDLITDFVVEEVVWNLEVEGINLLMSNIYTPYLKSPGQSIKQKLHFSKSLCFCVCLHLNILNNSCQRMSGRVALQLVRQFFFFLFKPHHKISMFPSKLQTKLPELGLLIQCCRENAVPF